MSIVNRKLGNGFVIYSVDSSKDNEHYFCSARKKIRLSWLAFSGSHGGLESAFATTGSFDDEFILSGAVGIEFSRSLYTSNNVPIVIGDGRSGFNLEPEWFSSVFGVAASGSTTPDESVARSVLFSCFVKRVSGTFDSSDFDIYLRDFTYYEPFSSVKGFGTFWKDEGDWYKFIVDFSSLSSNKYGDNFVGQTTTFLFSSSADNSYAFKNARLDFDSYLTDFGIKYFKDHENQNFEFGYTRLAAFPKEKTLNVSEFPHSSGLYQMPYLILGTVDEGRVGNTDDDLIQINHIGSVVYVFWPDQNTDSFVRGVGSYSPGQKPGKLSTTFEPGKFRDVSEYDHLTLFCYVDVPVSGTDDSVLIRIEKRPLRDNEFTINQSVEYEISGTFVEAIYRDVIHRKDIDYGVSPVEINWNIDIPLTNVKDLRISVKHKNGQTDEKNKNFITWGRLIKS